MNEKDKQNILQEINKYNWFHRIKVTDEISTTPVPKDDRQWCWDVIWDFLEKNLDFRNKRVLDVGCRDGLFSFKSEEKGAKEVIAIDNDLSQGAVNFLIPFFKSRIKMHELSIYDLTPDKFGHFDVVLCLGLLYHLRYPFSGLKKLADCLSENGLLVIESGMLTKKSLQNDELLYCPTTESPYEPTSCTFFNKKALVTTLESFGCKLLKSENVSVIQSIREDGEISFSRIRRFIFRRLKHMLYIVTDFNYFYTKIRPKDRDVGRQFFIFQKTKGILPVSKHIDDYWNSTHQMHTKNI